MNRTNKITRRTNSVAGYKGEKDGETKTRKATGPQRASAHVHGLEIVKPTG
jgi:hypothetical protein